MNKKNFFNVKLIDSNIEFVIVTWENSIDELAFLFSLRQTMTVEVEKIILKENQSEPDIIDLLVYDDRFFVTIDTIKQFCQTINFFHISRPLLSISELRRDYQ
ncbi:MAG TPA: hypothetical protein PLW93_01815 [Candidatus Absconditabacterales bacterium]|nr:hypothetical protein [Candidatus Absconditabacterales bacterium]HNG96986.1 hypothetical protein [Candidatus Absconditabacterales bacterium]